MLARACLMVLATGAMAAPAAASVVLGEWGDGEPSAWYDPITGEFGMDPVDPSYDPYLDCRKVKIELPKAPIIVPPYGWFYPNFPPGWDVWTITDLGTAYRIEDSSSYSLNLSGGFSFGEVLQTGLSKEYLMDNLTFEFSETVGGALQPGDLVYIPEPSALALLVAGGVLLVHRRRRKRV